MLNSLPVVPLLPCFVSLLHQSAPDWLKVPISKLLSLLPTRSDGVRQTISFVSASVPGDRSNESGDHGRATLTLETLEHASKLLSRIPSSISPDKYFTSIAPQLLSLLDDVDKDSQRVAAYIISQGILSRRATGAPGTAGWKYLADPFFQIIRPGMKQNTPPERSQPITSNTLRTALRRLSRLLLSHPNPAVLKRVMARLVLPIWTIISEARSTSEEFQMSSRLLQSFIKEADTSAELRKIMDNLHWSGESSWAYSLDASKHVEIVHRTIEERDAGDLILLMDTIPKRVELFANLLDSSASDEDWMSVFLHVLKDWLEESDIKAKSIGGADPNQLLRPYIYAQVAQQLISDPRSRMSSNSSQVVDLIGEILKNHVQQRNRKYIQKKSNKPSTSELKSIAASSKLLDKSVEDEKDSDDVVSISLTLLTTLLQGSGPGSSSSLEDALNRIHPTLLSLSQERNLPRSSVLTLRNLISQLGKSSDDRNRPQTKAAKSDAVSHSQAIAGLTATQAPLRAHSISQLGNLIKAKSPTISVPSTAITLLSLVQDQDSFVYLSAIRAIASLARLDPLAVVNQLSEAYLDRLEETALDVRLRIGEAMQSVAETLGYDLPQPVVAKLSSVLLQIAGRRTSKPKTGAIRRDKIVKRTKEREDAGLGPTDSAELSDSDSEAENLRSRLRMAAILEGWQGRPGEEDIRVRASSMSIVSTIIEHCDSASLESMVPQAMDVASTVLKLESEPEKAILRRAAVLIFMSVLKATKSSDSAGLGLGIDERRKGISVIELLQELKEYDQDEIVRGHAESVLESFEAWREEKIQRVIAGEDIRFGLEEKGGKLRGIELNVEMSQEKREQQPKPKIEEVQ